jgi:hypothetical protein
VSLYSIAAMRCSRRSQAYTHTFDAPPPGR